MVNSGLENGKLFPAVLLSLVGVFGFFLVTALTSDSSETLLLAPLAALPLLVRIHFIPTYVLIIQPIINNSSVMTIPRTLLPLVIRSRTHLRSHNATHNKQQQRVLQYHALYFSPYRLASGALLCLRAPKMVVCRGPGLFQPRAAVGSDHFTVHWNWFDVNN
jgi:hypothetical protein